MGYASGILNHRITFAQRVKAEAGAHGLNSNGVKYTIIATIWANVKFSKGAKALNEGAVDAYDVLMFRLRWRGDIDRWCLIKYHGTWYQIESFNEDYRDNQIQITARELTNQKVTIVTPSSSEI